jgi:hypothetical protein
MLRSDRERLARAAATLGVVVVLTCYAMYRDMAQRTRGGFPEGYRSGLDAGLAPWVMVAGGGLALLVGYIEMRRMQDGDS